MPRADRLTPAVLREREFRLLWSGQTVSIFGDGMLIIGLSFAVLDLTGSVTDLGLVLAISRIPLVLTVLAGGVVADRLSRRWVMVGADLVRLAAQGIAGALLVAGTAQLWQLLVLEAAAGTAAGFFYPASTGLVPLTVPPDLLQDANAFRGLSDAVARIAAPAVAGAIVVVSSAGWALVVDAATFAVSAVSLVLLHLPRHVRPPRQRFVHDLAEGWREFTARRWVWLTVVIAGSLGNLFSAFLTSLGPAIAQSDLGGAGTWGAIIAAQGVGGLIGGVAVLRLRVHRPLVAATLAWGLLVVPNLLLALVAPPAVIALGLLVGGFGLAVGQALWDTTLARHIPAGALSRVSSYDWFGSLVFNPVGFLVVGPLSAAIGDRSTLLIAAGWFAGSSLVLASLPSIRAVRDD